MIVYDLFFRFLWPSFKICHNNSPILSLSYVVVSVGAVDEIICEVGMVDVGISSVFKPFFCFRIFQILFVSGYFPALQKLPEKSSRSNYGYIQM